MGEQVEEKISPRTSLQSYLTTHIEQVSEIITETIKLHRILENYLIEKGGIDNDLSFLISDIFETIQTKLDILQICLRNTKEFVDKYVTQ